MKKHFSTVICIMSAIIILSVISGCQSDNKTKSYVLIYTTDDSTGNTILDPGNYPQLPFDEQAPNPANREIRIFFRGQEFIVSFYRSQFAGDGNYFYDYKAETGEVFTVDVNGRVVGFRRLNYSIDESLISEAVSEEVAAQATIVFEDVFGKDIAERYIADSPQIAPGYSTVDFHLTNDQKDNRFIYVDRVTIAILPNGELYFITGRNICRFDGKTVPDYFTDEYIERSVAELIKEKDVTVSVLKDEMRMITVNNGTLACKVGIEVTKGESSQLAEVLFVFD